MEMDIQWEMRMGIAMLPTMPISPICWAIDRDRHNPRPRKVCFEEEENDKGIKRRV